MSHLISSHLISPHLISSYLISSPTAPHLIPSHLISSHLVSPHLISPHSTSSHLTSPHLISFPTAPSAVQHPESSDDVHWPPRPAPMEAPVAVVSPSAGDLFNFKTTSTSRRIWAELSLHRLMIISETHAQKGHSITKMGWTHIKPDARSEPANQGPRLRQKWSQWSHLNHM